MSRTERAPQGTSIRETWGPAVSIEDIETVLIKAGAAAGVRARVLEAVRKHVSWELNKRIRPWGDLAAGGLSAAERERVEQRRARGILAMPLPDPLDGPESHAEPLETPDPARVAPPELEGVLRLPRAAEREIVIPLPPEREPLPEAEPEPQELTAIEAEPDEDDGDADDERVVEAIRELLGTTRALRTVPEPAPVPEMPREAITEAAEAAQAPGPVPEVPPAVPEPPEPVPASSEAIPEPAPPLRLPEFMTCRTCQAEKPIGDYRLDAGRWPRKTCRACEALQRKERSDRARLEKAGEMSKPCKECGVTKPLADFRAEKRNPDGRTGRCAACLRAAEAKRPVTQLLPEPGEGMALCTKCGEEKDAETGFYKRKYKRLGRATQCKSCEKEYARNYRKPVK